MDEFQLIHRYFVEPGRHGKHAPKFNASMLKGKASGTANEKARQKDTDGIEVDIGDDCAVLSVPVGEQLVLSIDTFLEGVHFFSGTEPELVAERALAVAVSDLAAMGAEPKWVTLALTLPKLEKNWLQGFSKGFYKALSHYGMRLVGGDTTKGPLTISVQVHGTLPEGKALCRSGADLDDDIYVSGALGDGAAALALLNGDLSVDQKASDYLLNRFYRPEAQVALGCALRDIANSAIDISDGLLADLDHICRSSKVGAVIDERDLPVSDALQRFATSAQQIAWALGGGDDYQLCFTAPPSHRNKIELLTADIQMECFKIGTIRQQTGIVSASTDSPFDVHAGGYSHF